MRVAGNRQSGVRNASLVMTRAPRGGSARVSGAANAAGYPAGSSRGKSIRHASALACLEKSAKFLNGRRALGGRAGIAGRTRPNASSPLSLAVAFLAATASEWSVFAPRVAASAFAIAGDIVSLLPPEIYRFAANFASPRSRAPASRATSVSPSGACAGRMQPKPEVNSREAVDLGTHEATRRCWLKYGLGRGAASGYCRVPAKHVEAHVSPEGADSENAIDEASESRFRGPPC